MMKIRIFTALSVWLSAFLMADDSKSAEIQAPATYAYLLQAERIASTRTGAVEILAKSGRDLIVLDSYFTEGEEGRWTAEEIAAIRTGKPGRKVVCYLSIGEAEDYRNYWQKEWKSAAPDFLLAENPDWQGNYKVKYWNPVWQALILKEVSRIRAQGFDGLLLDIVDGFEFFENANNVTEDHKKNPESGNTYRVDMIHWVEQIAKAARTKSGALPERPDFMVIPQNGSQLLADKRYVEVISGLALEDLYTLGDKRQPQEHIDYVMQFVRPFRQTGKPVYLTEYPTKKNLAEYSHRLAAAAGLHLLITTRALDAIGSN